MTDTSVSEFSNVKNSVFPWPSWTMPVMEMRMRANILA